MCDITMPMAGMFAIFEFFLKKRVPIYVGGTHLQRLTDVTNSIAKCHSPPTPFFRSTMTSIIKRDIFSCFFAVTYHSSSCRVTKDLRPTLYLLYYIKLYKNLIPHTKSKAYIAKNKP
jgi:hypothetical protein